MAALLDLQESDELVDLGCGNGSVALWFAQQYGVRVTGVDFSDVAITLACKRAATLGIDAEFVRSDVRAVALPADRCNKLVSIDVVQFIDAAQAAAEVTRLMRAGGRAVIRTWEVLEGHEVPLKTMVTDYAAAFKRFGLVLVERGEVCDEVESAVFYEAILDNERALREEMGEAAQIFIEEAQHMRSRRDQTRRVRKVLLTLQKGRAS